MMLVGDSVVICDFGLARMLGDVTVTATGIVGSPAYMAPECINRKPSAATDQYSLAVTYVELRMGRLPFEDETYAGVLEAHRTGNLDLSGLPAAEQDVIRKATRTEPSERFASCAEMVQALRDATLATDPVAAKPQRHRATSIVLASVIVALIGLALAKFWPSAAPRPSPDDPPAVASDPESQSITNQSTTSQSITLTFAPSEAVVEINGQPLPLDDKGQLTLEVEPDEPLRIAASCGDDFEPLERVFELHQLRELNATIELPRTAASYARSAFAKYVAGEIADAIKEYREATDRDEGLARPTPVTLDGHSKSVRALHFSPDGNWLVSASDDGACRVWKIGGAAPLKAAIILGDGGVDPLECLAIDATSQWLAVGGFNGRLLLCALREDAAATSLSVADAPDVLQLGFRSDGKSLFAVTSDRELLRWRLDDGGANSEPTVLLLGENEREAAGCERFALSRDGRWLLAIDAGRGLHRWDLQLPTLDSRKLVARLGFRVKRCLVRPATTELMMVGEAGQAASLDFAAAGGKAVNLSPGSDDFESLAIDPAGDTLLAGTVSGVVNGWRPRDGQFQSAFTWRKHADAIVAIAVTADGGWALSGGWDKTAFLWRLPSDNSPVSPLLMSDLAQQIHAVAIDPQMRWCATGREDGKVLLWDLRRCQLIQRATEGPQRPRNPREARLL